MTFGNLLGMASSAVNYGAGIASSFAGRSAHHARHHMAGGLGMPGTPGGQPGGGFGGTGCRQGSLPPGMGCGGCC